MSNAVLIWMLSVQLTVTALTAYFIIKVLRSRKNGTDGAGADDTD